MNDDNQQSNDDPAMLDNVKQLASEPAHTVEPPQQPQPFAPVGSPTSPAPTDFSQTSAVAEPAQGFSSTPIPDQADSVAPVVADPSPATTDTPSADFSGSATATPPPQFSSAEPADPDHLAGMKQEALEHLEPLVEHLDGTPEETFKTTMMMIQANDNHSLLEKALEAAKKIDDDKARAQAMLDIVNEINYFSQNN